VVKTTKSFFNVIYSYGIVFIDKMTDFSARSQSIRFSLVCAPWSLVTPRSHNLSSNLS